MYAKSNKQIYEHQTISNQENEVEVYKHIQTQIEDDH